MTRDRPRPTSRTTRRSRTTTAASRASRRSTPRSTPGPRSAAATRCWPTLDAAGVPAGPHLHGGRHRERPAVPGARDDRRVAHVRRPHAEGAGRRAQAQRHAGPHRACRRRGSAQHDADLQRGGGWPARAALNDRKETHRATPATRTRLYINEVATRDGFQMEGRFIPTDDKVALIDRLSGLGYAKIEVTSFTSPKAIPALRDGEEVMRRIARRARRGLHRAGAEPCAAPSARSTCRVDEFNLVMSTSETHNLANLRMTREQSFAQLAEVIALAQRGRRCRSTSRCRACSAARWKARCRSTTVLGWIDRFAALGRARASRCATPPAWPIRRRCRRSAPSALARHPGAGLHRALPQHARHGRWSTRWRRSRPASAASTCRSAASAAAPMRPARPATSRPRTWSTCCSAWATTPAWTCDGLIGAAAQLEALVQHDLPAQVSRAGHRLTRHAPPADFADIVARAAGAAERSKELHA